jgi:hypothetical protein
MTDKISWQKSVNKKRPQKMSLQFSEFNALRQRQKAAAQPTETSTQGQTKSKEVCHCCPALFLFSLLSSVKCSAHLTFWSHTGNPAESFKFWTLIWDNRNTATDVWFHSVWYCCCDHINAFILRRESIFGYNNVQFIRCKMCIIILN